MSVKTKRKKVVLDDNPLRHNWLFVSLILLIPTITFLVFKVYVSAQMFTLAFQEFSDTGWVPVGFKNIAGALREFVDPSKEAYVAIMNSLLIWAVSLFIYLPVGLFFSYVFFKKMPGSFAFRIIYLIPQIVPVTVMTMVYKESLEAGGYMHAILGMVGIAPPADVGSWFQMDSSFNIVMLYSLWVGVGNHVLYFSGNMTRIPTEVIESARLDGVGFWREFFNIVIPLITPILTSMVIMNFSTITGYWMPVRLLTNGGPNNLSITIALKIQDTAMDIKWQGYSSALGVIFTIIMVPIVMCTRKLLDKLFPGVEY